MQFVNLKSTKDFSDVKGLPEILGEFEQVVDLIKNKGPFSYHIRSRTSIFLDFRWPYWRYGIVYTLKSWPYRLPLPFSLNGSGDKET